METKKSALPTTTKFSGLIGILIFLFIVYSFSDAVLTFLTMATAAGADGKSLFAGRSALFIVLLAENATLIPFSALAGVFLWTKKRFAVPVIQFFLMTVMAFKIIELAIVLSDSLRKANEYLPSVLDTILVKIVLGVLVPALMLAYLFKRERKIDLDAHPKPPSDS
jgi:hypothetical protein